MLHPETEELDDLQSQGEVVSKDVQAFATNERRTRIVSLGTRTHHQIYLFNMLASTTLVHHEESSSPISSSTPRKTNSEEKLRSPVTRAKLDARFRKVRPAEIDCPSPVGGRSLRFSKIQGTPTVKVPGGKYDSLSLGVNCK